MCTRCGRLAETCRNLKSSSLFSFHLFSSCSRSLIFLFPPLFGSLVDKRHGIILCKQIIFTHELICMCLFLCLSLSVKYKKISFTHCTPSFTHISLIRVRYRPCLYITMPWSQCNVHHHISTLISLDTFLSCARKKEYFSLSLSLSFSLQNFFFTTIAHSAKIVHMKHLHNPSL
jgi:hypothetical protein